MCVDPVAIGFIIFPFSLKDVSIHMPELSFAVSLVFAPISLVAGSVRPHLSAFAVPHVVLPKSLINSAIVESVLFFVFKS